MKKKIALITGSTKGIGREVAKNLSFDHRVIITGRNPEGVVSLKNEIENISKDKCYSFEGDLTDLQEQEKLISYIQSIGTLDVVISNLGSGKSTLGSEIDDDEMRRVFEVNFFSAFSITQRCIPFLKKTNGVIVFISSIVAKQEIGAPIAYTAAKSALNAYSKSLATSLAEEGVRVNTLSPGNVYTKGGSWEKKLEENRELTNQYIQDNVPLKKFVTPEDVCSALRFLLENQSTTGANLIIDCGQNKVI